MSHVYVALQTTMVVLLLIDKGPCFPTHLTEGVGMKAVSEKLACR